MTMKRTEMKRGTKPLTSTKAMSRGTKPMRRGAVQMERGGQIKASKAPVRVFASPCENLHLEEIATAGESAPVVPKAPRKPRKGLKTTRPKMTAIRLSAKNEECTLRFPCCNYRIDTTVLCHRNGAGAGMKAEDTDAAYGCYACHTVLDGHAPRPEGFSRDMMLAKFDAAVEQTNLRLETKGLIEVGSTKNKSRPLLAQGSASTRIN